MENKFYKKPSYWFSSAYSIAYYGAAALIFSFYAIWLSDSIQLSAAQTGIIYSLNHLISMGVMFFYGMGQDKLVLKKNLVWFQSVIITGIAPFFIFCYEPLLTSYFYLGAIIGSCYLSLGFIAGMGLIDSYCEKISQAFNFEFGQARTWGCIAYAISTLFAGTLMSINPHYSFWVASFIGLCFMMLNFKFKPERLNSDLTKIKKADPVTFQEITAVFQLKDFWIFVIYVLGTYSLYNIYDQQLFPVYFTSLFSDRAEGLQIYGRLNSLQVFLEAAVMFIAPAIINRIGAKNALLFAAFISAVRILLTSYTTSIELIAIIKLMHCMEISTVLVAVFKYISLNFNKRLSATVFLIGYQVAGSIGVIAFSSIFGKFYDQLGPFITFRYLGFVVVFFMLFALVSLNSEKRSLANKKIKENQAFQ